MARLHPGQPARNRWPPHSAVPALPALCEATPPGEPDPPREATLLRVHKPRLLDRVRRAIRVRHFSRRTEQSYVGWIRRFILYHRKRHPPVVLTRREVRAVLDQLDGVPRLMAMLLYGAGLRSWNACGCA